MAFEYGVTVSFFSTTTKSIPYLMSWQARESPVGPAPMMMTSVLSVFIPSNLQQQDTTSPINRHGPKDVFLSRRSTPINTDLKMYLSGYATTPDELLSSHRVEKYRNR